MRRKFLIASLATIPTSQVPAAAAPRRAAGPDKRLLGVWRSDRERTAELWRFKPGMSPELRARVESLFGKLTLKFSASTWESELDGLRHHGSYRVVGSDDASTVVQLSEGGDPPRLSQYFYEGNFGMYVATGYNLEFFRRVEI